MAKTVLFILSEGSEEMEVSYSYQWFKKKKKK